LTFDVWSPKSPTSGQNHPERRKSASSAWYNAEMTTITLQDKFTEILTSYGDLQEAVNTALQRYTIDQITTKINELRRRDEEYKKKYEMDYPFFAKRSGEDEVFVKDVEARISKTWEADLADWEFCHEGIEDWTKKLQDILLK